MSAVKKESLKQEPWLRWGVSEAEWNDWHWQVRNRIQTVEELEKVVPLTAAEKADITKVLEIFRMGITP